MSILAESLRAVLIPFLAIIGTILVLLVVYVLLLHSARELVIRRERRLLDRYGPPMAAVLHADDPASSLEALRSIPHRHLPVLSELLLNPLRTARGSLADRARAVADALGLVRKWESDLGDRRSWTRAEAAHALGLIRYRGAAKALIRALDDPSGDVRAAAVEALGRIEDPSAVPELVARLSGGSDHQRVRLVEALQQFGAATVDPLLRHAAAHPDDLALVADLLGTVEAAGAVDTLLCWCGHERPDVRRAAVHAIGAVGIDDRGYYHVLRALSDDAAEVRAAAAWALGRSGREDAAAYLAARLQDEWIVAVQAARALRALNRSGRRALEAAATLEDGELARQMLWESDAGAGA